MTEKRRQTPARHLVSRLTPAITRGRREAATDGIMALFGIGGSGSYSSTQPMAEQHTQVVQTASEFGV